MSVHERRPFSMRAERVSVDLISHSLSQHFNLDPSIACHVLSWFRAPLPNALQSKHLDIHLIFRTIATTPRSARALFL
jgi:hypothetical protein